MDRFVTRFTFFLLCLAAPLFLTAQASSIEERATALKKQVIDLNRELFELEEELLYPANSQIVVFLAINSKRGFQLDSVELKVNGRLATTYLYSDREINALNRGGVQRLYMGNLGAGSHRIEAVFNGRGADDRYYRQQVSYDLEKQHSAKLVELVVQDSRNAANLPDFLIREYK